MRSECNWSSGSEFSVPNNVRDIIYGYAETSNVLRRPTFGPLCIYTRERVNGYEVILRLRLPLLGNQNIIDRVWRRVGFFSATAAAKGSRRVVF